jgi:hypothetical protein
MDDKYDNLPGYNYHEIKYKKNSYMYMEWINLCFNVKNLEG